MPPSKHSTWICRECEKKYIPARKKYGSFIFLCDDCSYRRQFEDEDIDRDAGRTDRYVGRMTEKGNEGIIIFRTDIASHKKQLQMEAKRGMAPNIMITSPVNQLIRDQEASQKQVDGEIDESKRQRKEEVPMEKQDVQSLDITGSERVEIVIRDDGKVIWVNTAESMCVLRICRIKEVVLHDLRTRKERENGSED